MSSKKYLIHALFSLVLTPLFSFGQDITIGERIPDIKLAHVINTDGSELTLSDYKGKLIILDFWGTGCTACIKDFPKIDSLQSEFKDKIQFIAVNKESEDSTLRFLQKHKRIKLPNIPFITEDKVLSRMFPHSYVPHHVWIDSTGVVKFITSNFNTSKRNLAQYFENRLLSLKQKSDISNFDYSKFIVAEGNGRWANKAIYYSCLLHGLQGVQAGGGLIKPNHFRRNGSIVDFLKIAYTHNDDELIGYNFESPFTIDLQVKDKFQYVAPKDPSKLDIWWENYGYFYELMVPQPKSSELFKTMQQDLIRYFNLEVSVKKRRMKCLALVKLNGNNQVKSNKSPFNDSVEYYRYNTSIKRFPLLLTRDINWSGIYKFLPIIGQTGSSNENIDIQISSDVIEKSATLNQLRKELNKCNLDLVERSCLINVLVIKERR